MPIEICNRKYRVLNKMLCYSVTMAITKFVQAEFDRAVQEELFDIKFIGFGEGLVTVFYKIQRHVKRIQIQWE